jgi:predicted DCC family thiol-disulfide oxidoreductase YuxK
MNEYKEPLVLFDGYCNLCDSTVQFIIKEDRKRIFRFAQLESDFGKSLLKEFDLESLSNKSVVFVNKGKAYIKSRAILGMLLKLNVHFKIFAILMFVIPTPFRDFIYDYISDNRYKWFGKKEECIVPTEDVSERFYL